MSTLRARALSIVVLVAAIGTLQLAFATPASADPPSTEAVSVSSDEVFQEGDFGSFVGEFGSISDDGRFVAFVSASPNLVADDTNEVSDVFVRDRTLGTTVRINLRPGGVESDVRASEPAISGDGEYVYFASTDTDLVAITGETSQNHIYRWERATGTLERVTSMADAGSSSPVTSDDGRYVAFTTDATNLLAGHISGTSDVLRKDMSTGTFSRVSLTDEDEPMLGARPSISDDGTRVVFLGPVGRIFVRDLDGGTTVEASSGVSGALYTGAWRISGDGSTALFTSNAGDPTFATTMYQFTIGGGPASELLPAHLDGTGVTISDDARYVAFNTVEALVVEDENGNADTYVYDATAETSTLASILTDGSPAPWAGLSTISGDGRSVLFMTVDAGVSDGVGAYVRTADAWTGGSPPTTTTTTASTTTTTTTVFDPAVCQWEWGGLQELDPQPCPAGDSIELSSTSRSAEQDRSQLELFAGFLVTVVGLAAYHLGRQRADAARAER